MFPVETIAIVAWGAMADVLYATPIVRQIRLTFPDAHISWLIRDKFVEVIETNPHINEVIPYTLPEGHKNRQEAEHVMDGKILLDACEDFDKVFDLQYWPRYSNFYENPSEDFISLRARNADIPRVDDRSIVLHTTERDEGMVSDFIIDNILVNPFITVNHISYAASAVWSFDHYEKLVVTMKERGVDCVFTGAPNEPIPTDGIDARGMPYRQWAKLMEVSDLWLGLDSGAVALACASDVPIIKLQSLDFPLAKTGIKAMGLRADDVLELSPAPSVDTLADLIMMRMRCKI